MDSPFSSNLYVDPADSSIEPSKSIFASIAGAQDRRSKDRSHSRTLMKRETEASVHEGLWNELRPSRLWHQLRGNPVLRSGLYLVIELFRTLGEARISSVKMIDGDFKRCRDPFKYETNPLEAARFSKQTELLNEVRRDGLFEFGLEIGCAE